MARKTKSGVTLKNYFRGGESDTVREIPPEFRAALKLTVEETPVPWDSAVDELDGDLILASKIERKQTGESVKRTTKKPTGSLSLTDQTYDKKYNVILPNSRTFQRAGLGIGQPFTEVHNLGNGFEIADSVDINAITAFLSTYKAVIPGRVRVQFPRELSGLNYYRDVIQGSGNAETDFAEGSWQGSGSYTIPVHNEAQASLIESGEFLEILGPERGNHRYLKTKKVIFFLQSPVNDDDVLARLTSILGTPVLDWPNFNPVEVVGKVMSRHISLRAHADYHFQDGGSDNGHEHAEVRSGGVATEVGGNLRTFRLPATIHSNLLIGGDFIYGVFTATNISVPVNAAGTVRVASASVLPAQASVVVLNLGATPGDTSIPNSGTRLLRCDSEMYEYGWSMLMTESLDFGQFAT